MSFKRILSFVLVLVMALSVFSFTAFAAEEGAEEVVLLGSFNNFEGVAMELSEGNTYTAKVDLEAGSYSFKIKNGSVEYSYPGTIKDTTDAVSDSGFVMDSNVRALCTLAALGGSYTFSFNTENNRLKVTSGAESTPVESENLSVNYGNGVTVAEVGDVISYNVYLTADKALDDLQSALNYNSEKLSLVNISEGTYDVCYPNLTEAIFNPDLNGVVTLNGSYIEGYDFTEEKLLLTLDFLVKDAGKTSLEFNIQEMTANDDTPYYTFSQKITEGAVIRESLEVIKKAEPATFEGGSITLTGQIAVNFYMKLSNAAASDENTKMVFTLPNGSKKTVSVKDAAEQDGNFVFTCSVAAKEMASAIKAQLITSDYEGEVFEYSVKDYAEDILSSTDEKYESAKPLVKAMLNYGAAAQAFFEYNEDNLANASLATEEKLVAEADLAKYNYSLSGKESGVSYYGSKLSLESETALKHYFFIEDEENIPEITVNGKAVAADKVNGYYEVKISDILAQNLDEEIVVTVGGITLNYNAMSYGYLAQQGENAELQDVINALYAYNQAAKAY